MSKYLIFDSETQIHRSHKRTANPFHPDNYVVMRGWKKQGDPRNTMQRFGKDDPQNWLGIADDVDVLVGFNIKFDLLYEMQARNPHLKAFYKRGGRVWCCQYAEYLIHAQERKYHMCSMDQIIESYGGRKKIDGMKELWKAGVQTSDIDPAMVEDYLIGTEEEGRKSGDIGNTELIYLGQIKAAEALGMLPALYARMDGLCATTEMEFNGIKTDLAVAKKDLATLLIRQDAAKVALDAYIKDIPDEVGFSWTSGVHKSCIIFGGRIKYSKQAPYIDEATGEEARLVTTEKWPLFGNVATDPATLTPEGLVPGLEGMGDVNQDVFVSGKKKGEKKFRNVKAWGEIKVRFQDFFYDLPGYTESRKEWETELRDGNDEPTYSTGTDVMDIILLRDIPFLKDMGTYQSLNKEIGTYYIAVDDKGVVKGMLTCVHKDGFIHHKLNHTTTVTTRLSSSDPNCQNIPRGDKSRVKAMFVSRFKDGVMGELDYSQLEVVVQGLLSRDKNLVKALNDRIDFHCKRVSMKFDITYEQALINCKDPDKSPDFPMWKQHRQGVKEFSFQRAYGAGAATIADATGMLVDEIKTMIKAEEAEYPGVLEFNAGVERDVVGNAIFFRDGERGYRTFRRGEWQAPTGTIYSWRSWDAPKWMREKGITDSFKPPELMNYPVQGTGGEIVQMVLGVLWRWFVTNNNFGGRAFLVNTVHDCVWVDMHPDVVDAVMTGMIRIMSAVPALLKIKYGIDCPVPFPVEGETGPNMLDLKHYHINAQECKT